MGRRRMPFVIVAALGVAMYGAPSGAALTSFAGPIASIGANQSSNWSGYNQGSLEQGHAQFHSVAGRWTVPTATQHTAGEQEFSASWIGIGGGCVDAGCTVTDPTLIQAGTSQDVAADGTATYYAWWELIPAPSVKIAQVPVHPGDQVKFRIFERIPFSNVWTFSVENLTTGTSWSKTTPYSSTHNTVEWIEETPLIIGGGGTGLSAMPDLSQVHFRNAFVNGHTAGLKASEELQLVNGSTVIATPSAPNAAGNGFNVCTFATTCPAP